MSTEKENNFGIKPGDMGSYSSFREKIDGSMRWPAAHMLAYLKNAGGHPEKHITIEADKTILILEACFINDKYNKLFMLTFMAFGQQEILYVTFFA